MDDAEKMGTRNVLHMSLGFLFVFFGFSTAQNFVVPLFGNIGSLSLGVLYFVFTFVLLAGPPLMNRLGGPKRAMVIGASGYVLYSCSLIYLWIPTIMLGSVVIGVSAALLWTGQGTFMAHNSNGSNSGTLSGYFWAMLMASNLFGNVSASLIIRALGKSDDTNVCKVQSAEKSFSPGWNGTDSMLFILLAGVGAVGVAILSCVPGTRGSEAGGDDGASSGHSTPFEKLMATVRVLKTRRMLLLSPLFFYTGIGVTFYSAQFTRQVCHPSDIGFIMAGLGAAEMAGSVAFGRLSDRTGSTVVVGLAAVLQAAALAVAWKANSAQNSLLYGAAALLGLADCGFQTMMYKVLQEQQTGDPEEAFAAYKFVQTLACTIGFLYTPLFVTKPAKVATAAQFKAEIVVVAAFLALGMLGFLILQLSNDAVGSRSDDKPTGDYVRVADSRESDKQGEIGTA
eukprot:g2712.t1